MDLSKFKKEFRVAWLWKGISASSERNALTAFTFTQHK